MKRPAAVSDILSAVFSGTPAEKRLSEGRIWVVWNRAVGATIAQHAQPSAFRDGTLTLVVDSGPWLQQLNFLKGDLVAKVNQELGEELIREVYLKAGKVNTTSAPKPQPKKRRPLSEEERAQISEQSSSVADPELRAVLESLIRRAHENS